MDDQPAPTRAVVLVEGRSDRLAMTVLARRSGIPLAAAGVSVLSMGGATNIRQFLESYGPGGRNLRVAGLCDLAEVDIFRRAVQRAGIGAPASRTELEALGFGVCVADLEDELIRAVGVDGVLRVLESQGELTTFRTLQRQPAQRARPVADQLRRFFGGRAGNKLRDAGVLTEALDLTMAPAAMRRALEYAVGSVDAAG